MGEIRWLVAVLLMLGIAGCASFTEKHSRTLLMNRSNGEIKECTVDAWRNDDSYERYQECIRDLEKQGYTVWNQY